MRIKNLLVAACIAGMTVSSQSCEKSVCGCDDPPAPAYHFKSGDVLLSGNTGNPGGGPAAAFWKNGVMTILSGSKSPSSAFGIAVAGKDIYVIGDTSDIFGRSSTSVYWKNGQLNLFGQGRSANAIFASGTDVYMAGGAFNSNGVPSAVYWKNGIMNTLVADPLQYSMAFAIFVLGNDVYVAGATKEAATGYLKARYWKNNVVTENIAARGSCANTIFVSGSDIYTGGYTMDAFGGSAATIWKNGTPLFLQTKDSWVYGVAISGNDVYAVGNSIPNGIRCWKNGGSIPLSGTDTTGITPSFANCIAVSGSDVYVAGQNGFGASIWKNGIETKLIDGRGISGICIAP